MKTPLQVGDRVRVYLSAIRKPIKGKVEALTKDGAGVYVIEDGFYSAHSESPFHVRWCRRLKPKHERRRVWIRERDIPQKLHSGQAVISASELVGETYVQFIEVRKK